MDRSLAELEAIVRDRICKQCTERTVNGECSLEDPSGCALFRLFPQVAHAIQAVDSDEIGPYIDAIRLEVCSVCQEQTSDAPCEMRRQVQCSLDSYLILVVDAIEEATGKTFDRSKVHSWPGNPPDTGVQIQ
jgi:hypothetical protein